MGDVERFDCYYLNDFNERYPAFADPEPDGRWVRYEDYAALRRTMEGASVRAAGMGAFEAVTRYFDTAERLGIDYRNAPFFTVNEQGYGRPSFEDMVVALRELRQMIAGATRSALQAPLSGSDVLGAPPRFADTMAEINADWAAMRRTTNTSLGEVVVPSATPTTEPTDGHDSRTADEREGTADL